MDTLRGRNMQKRRVRLLSAARGLLAQGGFEALNLRELARLADVTVPTIYNLIGNKESVLLALGNEVLAEIEARVRTLHEVEPIAVVAAVVEQSTRLFAEDEEYYRTAFLAVEALDQGSQHHPEAKRIYAWAERLVTQGIEACREAGLVRGQVPPAAMGELIMRSYRTTCRAWAFGHCDIGAFRRTALSDLYVTLAADAVAPFRAELLHRFSQLAAHAAAPTITQMPRNIT